MIPEKTIESMVRVNHAGEYAAVRLYQGQLKVLQESSEAPTLQYMLQQEKKHLAGFEVELQQRHLPPTLLQPVWHKAAFFLGVGSALLGKKTAMACTVAVEEAIDDHYKSQLETLGSDPLYKSLRTLIHKCHQEELEHRNIGLQKDAETAKGYKPLKIAIKTACKLAIFLSKKI